MVRAEFTGHRVFPALIGVARSTETQGHPVGDTS